MNQVTSRLIRANLTRKQLSVALKLFEMGNESGIVNVSAEELSVISGVSESTLTRALRELEKQELIVTTRLRKKGNKYGRNQYRLLSDGEEQIRSHFPYPKQKKQTLGKPAEESGSLPQNFPSLISEQSAHDQVVKVTIPIDKSVSSKEEEILRISTSPEIDSGKNKPYLKETKAARPKGGIKELSTDPKDFKTRGRRSIDSWTTWDVAAEFAWRLNRKFPMEPLLINQKRIEGYLRKQRASIKTTAKVELKLLDMFFEGNTYFRKGQSDPQTIEVRFFNSVKENINKARQMVDSDMAEAKRISERPNDWEEYLIARDGRRFPNTLLGKKSFDRYEARLNSFEPANMVLEAKRRLLEVPGMPRRLLNTQDQVREMNNINMLLGPRTPQSVHAAGGSIPHSFAQPSTVSRNLNTPEQVAE